MTDSHAEAATAGMSVPVLTADTPVQTVRSIWIGGLSAAGKSTLARLLAERIRAEAYPCALLDGDEMRRVLGGSLGYDLAARRQQTARVMRLVGWVTEQHVLSVVALIHPCEADRLACRQMLDGYFEISLECSLEECIRRDPKHLYEEALHGRRHDVVGIDIPYESAEHADLRLRSDRCSPEQLLEAVWERVGALLYQPSARGG